MATLKYDLKAKRNQFVDFEDLADFSSRLNECLYRIHKAMNSQETRPRFRVHQASIGSYCATMFGTGHAGVCLDSFFETVASVRDRKPLPVRLTGVDIKAFKKLAEVLDRHTESIVLNDGLPIDALFVTGCDWVLNQTSISRGQSIGRLDGINIHQSKYFRLYPEGIDRGAECHYEESMHSEVIRLFGKRVRVEGTIHRDPDSIGLDRITDITLLEEVPEDDRLPSLLDLVGLFEQSPVKVGAGWE